jgi:hypothetical protein
MYLTPKYPVLKSFASFQEAAVFARLEAKRRGYSLALRRDANSGWNVCSIERCALNDFLYFTKWLGHGHLENPVSELRKLCIELGLTSTGWRFIHRHGASAYRGVLLSSQSEDLNLSNALCWVDWQVRGGLQEPLPELLSRNYLASMGLALEFEHPIDPRLAGVVARHWKTLNSDQVQKRFAEVEWVRVLVWMRDNAPHLDRNQWRAGWPAIYRVYKRWRNLHEFEDRWDSALGEIRLGVWHIVPLQTSFEVALEGIRMKHCVATYASRCLLGEYRLFSIRDADGHRIATVGLEDRDKYWVLEQVKGKCNKSVGKDIEKVAKAIVQRYISAEARLTFTPVGDTLQT